MKTNVYMTVDKNTSLRDTLRTDATLAAQVHRKYGPERFKRLAGIDYVAPLPTPPAPPATPQKKRERKRKQTK